MKKNIIIIIAAFALITMWTIVRTGVISASVKKVINNKPSAIAYQKTNAENTLQPFKVLVINTNDKANIHILQDATYRMGVSPHLKNMVSLKYANSDSVNISLVSESNTYAEIYLYMPSIEKVYINNIGKAKDNRFLEDIEIANFKQNKLRVFFSNTSSLIFSKIKVDELEIAGTLDDPSGSVNIKNSVMAKKLNLSIKGNGTVDIFSSASEENNFKLSDSLKINAPTYVLQKAKIGL